jgi:hypothetical protein
MQAASLEILEKANVPAPQARTIVQAIGIEIEGARDTLATKQDLLLLRTELRHEMMELGAGLRTEMANLRSDLRTEMHALASGNMRQLYLPLLGQMAVLLGIAYFFVERLPR